MADLRRSPRTDSDMRSRAEDEKVRGLAEEESYEYDDDVEEMDESLWDDDDEDGKS